MRPSSVFARCALAVALSLLASCAKPKPAAAPPEPTVTLEGEVRLAGASPLEETLTLADAGGSFCTLLSPRYEYELRNLAGQTVRVKGRLLGKTANGPEFLVESYEMAAVDGRPPIIGTIIWHDDGLVVTDERSGQAYRLGGPLAGALRAYSGCKVWVSGPKVSVDGETGGGMMITVESYGVLAEAAGATSPGP